MSINIPIELVSVGAAPNDGTGDSLRVAFQKTNNNTRALVNAIDQATTQRTPAGFSPSGKQGDVVGMMLVDDNYLYVCVKTFDNNSPLLPIWKRIALENW